MSTASTVAGQVLRRTSQNYGHGRHTSPVTLTLMDLSGRQVDSTRVDTSGEYAMEAPAAGTYLVVCSARSCQPSVNTVTLQGDPYRLDIVLEDIQVLTGVVRLASGGRGVDGVLLLLVDEHGDVAATATTTATGEYQLVAPSTGTYTVAVNAPGYRPLAIPVQLAGDVASQDIEVFRSGRVVGTVRNTSNGPPVDRARVVLVHPDGGIVESALTGPDGRYAFDNLEENDYTLVATSQVVSATAVSVRGHPVEHDIRFSRDP